MRKVWAIGLNTFREAIRNRILYSVLLFAALLIGLSAFFGAVTIGSQTQVVKDFGLFAISFGGAALSMLLGVSLLHREQTQKTIYNILSKPVSRWQFLLGKHLGLSLTVSVIIAAMGLGLVGFSYLLERRLDWLLFQGIALAMMEGVVIAAIVILFSSIAITTALPGILTLAAYIAGHSLSALTFFLTNQDNPVMEKVAKALFWIIPDLSLFNANAQLVYGGALTTNQVMFTLLYCVGYSGVALTLATCIFSRRELV